MPSGKISRPWSSKAKPPLGTLIDLDHPLIPSWGMVFQEGGGTIVRNLVPGFRGVNFVGTPIWSPTEVGHTIEFPAITDHLNMGDGSAFFTDLTTCTIVLGWEKTDATNRKASAFATSHIQGQKINTHIPWNDGTVYWDWGSTGANGRQAAAGLTLGNDNWAFLVAPNLMQIWQNGIQVTNKTSSDTRILSSADFLINDHATSFQGDLAICRYFYIYDGLALTPTQIHSLHINPYQIFISRRYWTFQPVSAQTRMLLTGVGI